MDLLERRIVEGIDFFTSERSGERRNAVMRGDGVTALSAGALVGCTDDPAELALFERMCRVVLGGTRRPGSQSVAT